ncbi:acyl-CoA dehydrogenase [candidate division KSB1 bacterium]|nr:acyl-CoA dehydrogenase [candidate division KSB1 bacterium]
MDFRLTEEHEFIKQMARDFAEKELAPGVRERDEKQEFPHEAIKKLGELGFMGVVIPEEYGGAGLDSIAYVIIVEELSRVEAAVGTIIAVNNSLYCCCILNFGTEEQKEKFLKPIAGGNGLGAYSLSEAGSGSDAASLKTRIKDDGDHYIMNGTKMWVTNGANASHYIIFATIDPEKRHKGISALIVERETEGLKIGKKENKLGIRSSDTVELIFENARIPKANLLGKEGEGFNIAMQVLDNGRISIAAQAVGIAQGALDAALKYSGERVQFGKPIFEFQAIQIKLANMATEIEAGRLLTYQAALLREGNLPFAKEASMAKLFCSGMANRAAVEAVQIHGGYGYLKDFDVERFMRDAKITDIYEGTSEIQRLVIAKHLKNDR